MGQKIDLHDKRFGRLLVIAEAGKTSYGHSRWKCICDCGQEKFADTVHLRTGKTKSCGCLRAEMIGLRARTVNRIHGHTVGGRRSPEYRSWMSAKERCNNPHNIGYADYGGRGIQFQLDSFERFYTELGPRPDGMTLDRIDPNGHYTFGNVKWSTRKEQRANQRPRKRIEQFATETLVSELAKRSLRVERIFQHV